MNMWPVKRAVGNAIGWFFVIVMVPLLWIALWIRGIIDNPARKKFLRERNYANRASTKGTGKTDL